MEETMKKVTLTFCGAAFLSLAAPALAADRIAAGPDNRPMLSAPRGSAVAQYAGMKEQYATSKKKGKKKSMTKRSSWGG
jgi:hypothetical protein